MTLLKKEPRADAGGCVRWRFILFSWRVLSLSSEDVGEISPRSPWVDRQCHLLEVVCSLSVSVEQYATLRV